MSSLARVALKVENDQGDPSPFRADVLRVDGLKISRWTCNCRGPEAPQTAPMQRRQLAGSLFRHA
jgi:hypothetical protein